jgi:hypothetical protein
VNLIAGAECLLHFGSGVTEAAAEGGSAAGGFSRVLSFNARKPSPMPLAELRQLLGPENQQGNKEDHQQVQGLKQAFHLMPPPNNHAL